MKLTVDYSIPSEPKVYAAILNEMGSFLEEDYLPPDHWDKSKRIEFYRGMDKYLTDKAKTMLKKVNKKK